VNEVRIADATDPRLADYRQLKDTAARRRIEADELFVAEGPTSIERLVASDHQVRSVLVTERKLAVLEPVLASVEAPIFVVDVDLLREIVGFDLHRGAIAAADRRADRTLAEVLADASRVAVLEGLNDPENLGAIARSARAFGIDALVLDPTCIDPYTRRTVRVSMGEILHLDWCRVGAAEWPGAVFEVLRSAGFDTWAMTPSPDSRDIWTLDVPECLAVAFGAEGPGLSQPAIAAAQHQVRLPIREGVDSLNVGAAAAVTFAVVDRARLRE